MLTIHELTIDSVSALKNELLGELAKSLSVDVDLSQVSAADFSGLQLLVGLVEEADKTEKKLTFHGLLPWDLRKILDFSGLTAGNVDTGEFLLKVLRKL